MYDIDIPLLVPALATATGTLTFTLAGELPAGDYVVTAEIVAGAGAGQTVPITLRVLESDSGAIIFNILY